MLEFINNLSEILNQDFSECLKIHKDTTFLWVSRASNQIINSKEFRIFLIQNYTENYYNAGVVVEKLGEEFLTLPEYINHFINEIFNTVDVTSGHIELPEKTNIKELIFAKKVYIYTDKSQIEANQIRQYFSCCGLKLELRDDFYKEVIAKSKIDNKPIEIILNHKNKSVLNTESYENIINSIFAICRVMEWTVAPYRDMEEEHLRNILYASLNDRYDASVSSETFNREGKTDILLRAKNVNVFVGECKIWRGEKSYLEAIDQLLNYVTWRDEKTAIILFYKDKNLSRVVNKISDYTQKHNNFFQKDVNYHFQHQTRFRFQMKHKNDEDRIFTMSVLLIEIPH